MTKADIVRKLEYLESEVPCGVNVLLLYGTETLHEILQIKSDGGVITLNFRNKDYFLYPTFVPAILDDTIQLAKFNPE